MENRIEINGTWYRKEEKLAAKVKESEIMYSKEIQIDLEDRSLVASCLTDEKCVVVKMVSLDLRNLSHDTSIETMDNGVWLLSVANRDSEALAHLDEDPVEVQNAIVQICDKMKELNWIG